MGRYFAVVSAEQPLTEDDLVRLRGKAYEHGFLIQHASERWFLASCPHLPVHLDQTGSTVLLGVAFEQGDETMTAAQVAHNLLTNSNDSTAVLRRFWGSFVLFANDCCRPSLRLLRSPFGRLGCLYAQYEGKVLVGSDLPSLRFAGLPSFQLDATSLIRWIGYRELPAARTCIRDLRQLLGGREVRITTETEESERWSPWYVAGPGQWRHNEAEARDGVHAAVLRATRILSASSSKSLLLLSGGLDSSILAASLDANGGNYACLNLVHRSGSGDERSFARSVSSHLNCELLELD